VSGAADNLSAAEGATPKTALVFLIFLAAGPPLGSLLLWASAIVVGYGIRSLLAHDLSFHLRSIGILMVSSYAFGGLQALFVAVVAAIAQSMSRAGLVPLLPILLASLLAGAAHAVFGLVKSELQPRWDVLSFFVGLHIAAGLLCWLVCNSVLWPSRRRFDDQVVA
jgi:hypothetical protein